MISQVMTIHKDTMCNLLVHEVDGSNVFARGYIVHGHASKSKRQIVHLNVHNVIPLQLVQSSTHPIIAARPAKAGFGFKPTHPPFRSLLPIMSGNMSHSCLYSNRSLGRRVEYLTRQKNALDDGEISIDAEHLLNNLAIDQQAR